MVETKQLSDSTLEAKDLEIQEVKSERSVKTEKLKLIGTNVIVLYHSPGVGGSTLAEMLKDKIDGAIFYDGGKEIRNSQGYTSAHTEYIPRDVGVDKGIDEIQMELMRNATPEHPVIIDAKLGGFNAFRLMHENPSINVIPVLITCAQKTAAERMKKRTAQELEKRFNLLSEAVLDKKITEEQFEFLLDEIRIKGELNTVDNKISETKKRIEKDRIQFAKAHGILKGVDLYNPGARVIVGYDMDEKTGKPKPRFEKLWRIKQSTTRLTPDDAFEELVDKLVSLGNVKRIRKPKKATTLSDVFGSEELEEKRKGIGAEQPITLADIDEIESIYKEAGLPEPITRDFDTVKLPSSGEIFNNNEVGEKDAAKTGKKVKTNGKNHPKESFRAKPKTETRNGKSVGEPVSRRSKFPSQHPNPDHPSKNRKGSDSKA